MSPPMDWHELWVLCRRFQRDENCQLHREINPDWEWNLSTLYQALALQAIQAGNWQRGGGQNEYPTLRLPSDLRGKPVDEDGNEKVDRGAVAVDSAAELGNVTASMEERRAAIRARRAKAASSGP